jgi:hypothetical protein
VVLFGVLIPASDMAPEHKFEMFIALSAMAIVFLQFAKNAV